MAGLKKLRRDVCAIENEVVNTFLPVGTSGLLTLRFHLVDRLIDNVLRFGSYGVYLHWMRRNTNNSKQISK